VVAVFSGDGGTSEGDFHEAANLAAVWRLPVLFVVENNGWGLSTPTHEQYACEHLADRGPGYGMPGVVVDGQDVLAVWEVADLAVRRARAGDGPTLIECKTYRYHGHASSDNPRRYRTADEEEQARARDCIARFRENVLSRKLLTQAELDEIDARNTRLIDEAVKFADESPLPEPSELLTDVYVPER
jgi:pyruvate dehydrogenase E1 component alpha subunit